jgi:cyclic pyranopterin phosphate synthase
VSAPLTDGFGRTHRALRLSVTDRCNLRCRYCMPAEGMDWLPGDGLMTRAEIARVVGVLAGLGVREVRVTGGEPLLRRDLAQIVGAVRATPGVREVSLTTNGVMLADRVAALLAAGLDRVNVSLDSLDPERFAAITRRDDLARVLAGLDACAGHPRLRPIKVNVVLLRGLSEPDVLPLAGLARRRRVVVRFIEAMPIDAGREWTAASVIPGEEVRAMVAARWPLEPMPRERASAPGARWRFADGAGEIQFVSSVSQPFCAACDRLRVTADGRLRTCLFAEEETDLLGPLRAGAEDDDLVRLVRAAVAAKQAGHGIGAEGWEYAGRPMSRIGG